MSRPQRIGWIGLVVFVAATFGCGSTSGGSGGEGSDQSVQSVQSETSEEANVDLSDGKIQVSDGEGGTVEIEAGADASLPDGFPSELEVAGTTRIIQASTSTAGGNEVQAVTLQFEGSVADTYAAYKTQLEEAGYVIESDSSSSTEGAESGNVVATKGPSTVNATFGGDGQGNKTASISVQAG